jgi:beta-lactamase regulating signal transducer with metallopeptidase domain
MNMPVWFSNVLFWSAQVALLVMAAGLLARVFQLRQPRVLLVYWRSLLAVSLLLPILQPWHRPTRIAMTALSPDFDNAALPPSVSLTTKHWHLPSLEAFAQILGAVVLAGIGIRLAILALGLLKLRRLRRASSPLSLAESTSLLDAMRTRVSTHAEFRLSPDVDSPVTFGFAAPIILLPHRFPSMDARFQSAIACHELLHVRRHDWAHHIAEEILRSTFWFHPAIAWLISRVRLAREQVVDLEVVNLTNARKPYLEALLEFTNSRASIAAIPAPPFLAERQLVERVALMLKEVRMSRTRLIASLIASSFCIATVVVLAAWTFPLKAAPRAQNAPQGGVSGGIEGGIRGGVAGGVNSSRSQDVPTVYNNTIWTDTVKRGPMFRQVRGLGTLVRGEGSKNLVARVALPEFMMKEVRNDQSATVDTRKGLVKGHVSHMSEISSD